MRFAAILTGLVLLSAPALAAPGVWQWEHMDLAQLQPMSGSQLAAHVGDWVYADDGSIVGSLDSVTATGAGLRVSHFFRPGAEPLMVPSGDIGVMHGRLVIHGASFDSLSR